MRARFSRRQQRGTTLLEGLVTFLVLSLGMLSVVRVQSQLRLNSDVARQRSEAVRIAQEDLEKLRAFSSIAARPGASAYAGLASATLEVDTAADASANTRYTLAREVADAEVPASKSASVTVSWSDRSGAQQRIALNTLIAGIDPAYSGALRIVPRAQPVRGALARSPLIPWNAHNLGNGSSAYKPVADGGIAYVFDNATGRITSRCAAVDPQLANAGLSLAALGACAPVNAVLLGGVIRFTNAVPPQPDDANETPPAVSIALTQDDASGSAAPECTSEVRKGVTYTIGGVTRTEGLPLAESAASTGATGWVETGERYAAYFCAVHVAAPGAGWSGRSTLVPSGWTIGTGSADRRVCRYTADLDRSGTVDNNLEHPDAYRAVTHSLTNQNFLVIKGSESCPASVSAAGANALPAEYATAQHQP